MATTLYDTLLPVALDSVLTPIKMSTMRKNNMHRTKTDKINTYIIAKNLMMQDPYRFVAYYALS